MTLEELIKKGQDQYVPVSDEDSKKELRNLNKSIQELTRSVQKDRDSATSDSMKSRMRDMIDRTISQTSTGIKKIEPRLFTPKSKMTREKDDSSKVDGKLVDTISKSNNSLIGVIKQMRADIAGLKNILSKPQQREKMLAGGIDPNLTRGQRQDRGLLNEIKVDDKDSGGGFFKNLLGLGAGALTGAALWKLLPDEMKEKIKGVLGDVFVMLKDGINEMLKTTFGTTLEGILDSVTKSITDFTKTFDVKQLTEDFVDKYKVELGAALAAVGLVAYKGIESAIRMLPGIPSKAESQARKGTEKALEAERKRQAQAVKDEAKQKVKAEKATKAAEAERLRNQRIEPTMGDTPDAEKKDPRAKAKDKIPEKISETEEQRAAREKATQKAKDEIKSRKVPMDDIKGKKTPGFLDKLKGAGKGLGRFARFAGPAGALLGIGMTAYETANAATNAEDVLGIEGRKATFGEKVAAGVGGFAEGVSFGLVNKEDVAKKIAGQPEQNVEARNKTAAAIERKANQAKTEKEIAREISMKKIQLQKLAGRDGKVSKSDLPEARQLASDIADLNADLRNIRAMPQEQRAYQPTPMLRDASAENRSLTLPAANMGASPYAGMMQNIQNVFNSSNNQTNISSSKAGPRNESGTISRYLDRLFAG